MNIESLQLELSKNILNKKIVYFDTKFWILLRDSVLYPEKENSKTTNKLLRISKYLFKNGVCVFPISDDIFIEIIKQTDIKTRRKTFEIIEELSGGITLISYDERVKCEIKKLLNPFSQESSEIINSVWTLNKSLLELLETINNLNIELFMGSLKSNISELTTELNTTKHLCDGDFKTIFETEIYGIIKADGEGLVKALSVKQLKKQDINKLMGLIYSVCISSKSHKELPSLKIRAGLSASVKLQKNQKFKPNDWHDFNHAIAALVYADYFFTEHPLSHLIKHKPLSFDKVYHCVVESKVENSISKLEQLIKINKTK